MRPLFPREVGWMPYVWLFYLVFPILQLAFEHASGARWLAQAIGLGAFLGLYVAGYRDAGSWREWAVIATMTALAIVMTAFVSEANFGMFIYAGAFVGFRRDRSAALLGLAGLGALQVVLVALGRLDPGAALAGIILTFGVGLGNLSFHAQHESNQRLQRAQDEIERLAKVEERERIARDLHDLLGHSLSVVILKSHLARRLVADDPLGAGRELDEIGAVARQALAQVRAAVAGYRSQGIAAEIAGARAALESAGVRVEHFAEPLDWPPLVEGTIALALREATTNVLRHSGARTCWIEVRGDGDGTRLTVRDDGRGIGDAHEGSGLRGMRERLAALEGSLVVGPAAGGGTELVATAPLRRLAATG